MKSITAQKPFDELKDALEGFDRIFVIGCGTCTTMMKTGGVDEVSEIAAQLQDIGKLVTGTTVIPTACDEMTEVVMEEHGASIDSATCMLVMSCALGVQKLASYIEKPVVPGVDTLFIGVEDIPGTFKEACDQCGQCVLGETAGICPVTACHKGLVNGPCGGTNNGMCEVDPESPCAWTLIYQRLERLGQLELMKKYHEPKNYHVMPRPKIIKVP
ncbi:MAG: methylenetetrahydrofolate reductase C-terminal domain-containing protein [Dehalococcoidia bacterium]